MAAFSTLRTLFYAYMGTVSTDPFYPTSTVNALINSTANKYIGDVQQMNPAYLSKTTTLSAASSTSHSYTLPSDFAGWLEVRITDVDGALLAEVRSDEINLAYDAGVFSITGVDSSATLVTASSVEAGKALYLKYTYQPTEMSADADTPSWMPTQYHDLIAREAAIDAYGLGAESAPSGKFIEETQDRRGQFWFHVSRRGVQPMQLRQSSP